MNNKGLRALFIGLISTAAVLVTGGFIGDYLLRQNFGFGIGELANIVLTSGVTLENSRSVTQLSIEDIGDLDNASELTLTELIDEKTLMESEVNSLVPFIQKFNNNTDLTTKLKEVLGEQYSVYLFTVAKILNESVKIFEWSIEIVNGEITTFESGKTKESFSVIVQMDQSIASQLINDPSSIDIETAVPWVTQGLIKINPITEAMRVISFLPQIFEEGSE